MADVRERAAAARAAEMAARADRPMRRRNAEPAGSRATVRTPARVELRAAESGSGLLHYTGIASATEHPYEMWDDWGPYTEVIDASAFDATLARADLDVPLVLGHDQLRRIARTTNGSLTLSMTDEGLLVDAPALDPADADVAYIAPKLRAGLIDEMSFAFRIDAGMWSPDYTEFRVMAVDLHRGDTAIVGFGANPATSGGLRSAAGPSLTRQRVLLDLALAI